VSETMMHTDAAQTADLHAIPAFAEAMRARGLRRWDVVECGWYEPEGPHLVLNIDEDGDCWLYDENGRCVGHGRPADCRLRASEADLMDYLTSTGLPFEVCCDGEDCDVGILNGWYTATTRIGALVAAVKAVEGGE
jgi:hypothetical protein